MTESDIHKPDTGSGAPASGEAGTGPPRRAGIRNFFLALRHINEASVADAVRQRFSDYVSIGLVIICIFSLVGAVALPVSLQFRLLPLIFTVGAIVFYIINRLGIVLSLSQRQALIVWQILSAAFWLGVTSAMLVILSCFYFFNMGGRL